MGRASKKEKRHPTPPPYVAFRWDILNSCAYKKLAPSAAKLLPYFLGKVKCRLTDPALYTTEFPFTFEEARRCGFARTTFRKGYLDLEAKGFIKRTFRGGLRAGNVKVSNVFRLSQDWERFGEGGSPVGIEQVKPDEAEVFINEARGRASLEEVQNSPAWLNISKESRTCTGEVKIPGFQCPKSELTNPLNALFQTKNGL